MKEIQMRKEMNFTNNSNIKLEGVKQKNNFSKINNLSLIKIIQEIF